MTATNLLFRNPADDPRPAIVYVGDIAPIDRVASEVVMFRHLRALEAEGHAICVVTTDRPGLRELLPMSWTAILLPARRFFYPPYRPYEPLRTVRWLLNDRVAWRSLHKRPVRAVVSLLMGENLAGYAEWLARRLNAPLFYFYHDRGETLHHAGHPSRAARMRRQNLRLLRAEATRRVWTVSEELTYPETDLAAKFLVVPPLPHRTEAPTARWDTRRSSALRVAHIGTIYNEAVDTFRLLLLELRKAGGSLLVYTHHTASARLLAEEFPDIIAFAGFEPDSNRLMDRIGRDSNAFLVVSPRNIEAMPWSLDCFPSKFPQLVQTGLPGLVFAPARTSIGHWCLVNNWKLYRDSTDAEAIRSALAAIASEDEWNEAARQSREVAGSIFDPSRIESLILRDICLAEDKPIEDACS